VLIASVRRRDRIKHGSVRPIGRKFSETIPSGGSMPASVLHKLPLEEWHSLQKQSQHSFTGPRVSSRKNRQKGPGCWKKNRRTMSFQWNHPCLLSLLLFRAMKPGNTVYQCIQTRWIHLLLLESVKCLEAEKFCQVQLTRQFGRPEHLRLDRDHELLIRPLLRPCFEFPYQPCIVLLRRKPIPQG